ncbi:MAG: peptidoglycan-binding domain-containing protein [Verrucomicrobiales bacterium]
MFLPLWLIIAALCVSEISPVSHAGPFGGALGGSIAGGMVGGMINGPIGRIRGSRVGATMGFIGGMADNAARRANYDAYYHQQAARHHWEAQQQQARAAASRRQTTQYTPRTTVVQTQSNTLVLETQKALVRLGFDPGPIEGEYGPNTARAIRQYQQRAGLLATGQASQELLKHMLRNGG